MKKIITLMAVALSMCAYGQESFPNKHPELLVGKQIKAIETSATKILGYMGLYSDPELSVSYTVKNDADAKMKPADFMAKEFKVTAVDSIMPKYGSKKTARVSLEGADGQKLYYEYKAKFAEGFPFEVKGGLDLPAGFYCDLVEKSKYGPEYIANVATGTTLTKHVAGAETNYTMTFMLFGPKSFDEIKSVILVLENGKSIVDNDQFFYPSYYSEKEAKYTFTVVLEPKEAKMLAESKLLSIKAGKLVLSFTEGAKLAGVIKCMEPLK